LAKRGSRWLVLSGLLLGDEVLSKAGPRLYVEWSQFDLGKRQVNLPAERTRNGKPHIVPLSDQALAVLAQIKRKDDRCTVFGKGVGGFSGWSKAKIGLDGRIAAARKMAGIDKPMPPWVLHDLRRSFVTHVSERGFAPPHVVECCVNHISGFRAGVAGTYNLAAYLSERRQAFDLWGAHIAALVAGRESKIVPLMRARLLPSIWWIPQAIAPYTVGSAVRSN
jgi:integrase